MVDMRSASDEPLIRWKMPDSLRGRFGRIVGKIVEAEELKDIDPKEIACVGDVCTISLLENGIKPKICIVDYATKRFSLEEARAKILGLIGHDRIFWLVKDELNATVPADFWLGIRVRNPQSTITQELWDAVAHGYGVENPTLIVVEGEEDLAALVCIALGKTGTKVIYGIPDVGMQLLHVTEELKRNVNSVLKEMEVQKWKSK
ncbi:MAG: GTP-dependent dephospho-CoA kinase family protein [Thermoplasmata archaeon]|nr:GTP-dependent dephospho-CoA kinase family protein [Thermoplasmata archaeon]